MPSLDKIMPKKTFKKKDYRAYDMNADKVKVEMSENDNGLIKLNPTDIIRWEHKDRLDQDMGDMNDLIHSLKNNGQQTPCIVRKLSNSDKYELIAGERRWRALTSLNQKVLCTVYDVDDKKASIIQAIENEKREGLSDYAKALSFDKKIKQNILTKKDLKEQLNLSDLQISRLLSFTKIDNDVEKAIEDFHLVSARTAAEINRIVNKGENYKREIIKLADKIRSGALGSTSLEKEVSKALAVKIDKLKPVIYKKPNISVKQTGNQILMHISKDMFEQLENTDFDMSEFVEMLDEYLSDKSSK